MTLGPARVSLSTILATRHRGQGQRPYRRSDAPPPESGRGPGALAESSRGPVGRRYGRRVGVLIDEELGGAIYIDRARHRFDFRHPAAIARASVQNHRSPFAALIFVRS